MKKIRRRRVELKLTILTQITEEEEIKKKTLMMMRRS